jgi:hypothetical protein
MKIETTEKTHQTLARGLRFGLLSCGGLLAALTIGCTGNIAGDPNGGPPSGSGNSSGGGGNTITPPPPGTDVGRVEIHRLNNLEYANTIRDLVGIEANTANFNSSDGKADGFDNIASEFGVTDEQYASYFNSAVDISDRVFADMTASARILTCTPTGASDTACIKSIIQTWGLKAWRRPIKDNEITALTKLATDAITAGETGAGGIKQIVKSMLASPNFLFRIEYDSDPASTKAHPLDPYELASRLSYLHWSTMPDQTLFDLAANGKIMNDDTITAQVDRMLADARGQLFIQRFGGQWLGMETLLTHQVEPTAFPTFDEPLRQAMYKEGLLYFQEFLLGGGKMKDFFTTKVNFVNARLAKIYGISGITGDQPTRLNNMAANRVGFMGLAGFLTQSSYAYRTTPTLRGKWVLENLLCQEIPQPPNDVPKLDPETPAGMMMGQSENVRTRLEMHRADPKCAACHAVLDPIGLGLETFDAIGQYRQKYLNGDVIDPAGIYDGKNFTGLDTLATMLSDPASKYAEQLTDCATKKLLTYSLSRTLDDTDPFIKSIGFAWGGGSMKDLLKKVVLSSPFRFRHGEP